MKLSDHSGRYITRYFVIRVGHLVLVEW